MHSAYYITKEHLARRTCLLVIGSYHAVIMKESSSITLEARLLAGLELRVGNPPWDRDKGF